MKTIFNILAIAFALSILTIPLSAAYSTTIKAPAVIQNADVGTLTSISLNLHPGNGEVTISGPMNVNQTTISSAQTAALYASGYLGLNATKYDFSYTISDASSNVSGPSAGLAFTLLAYYALINKQLSPNFTVTGTIDQYGNVGPVGGVYDKAGAASQGGLGYLLVPAVSNSSLEGLIYYISEQDAGIPLVEVSNFTQAAAYSSKPPELNLSNINPDLGPENFTNVTETTLTCQQCNMSYFSQLSNYTFFFVANETDKISSNYSLAKSQLLESIINYQNISAKGYLYTGADLAFLKYTDAFILANSGTYTPQGTSALIQSVSDYCTGVKPAQLTEQNYEYVASGELRQALAEANIQQSISELNSSESTDDIIGTVGTVAQSAAWCNAAAEMYNIASQIGGTPAYEGNAIQSTAQNGVTLSQNYGGLYSQAAQIAYNASEYSASLYASGYARILEQPSASPSNLTADEAYIQGIADNSTFGAWPTEFANSALFYVQQAKASQSIGAAYGYLTSADTVAEIAQNLSVQNQFISSNLFQNTSAVQQQALIDTINNQSKQITQLKQELDIAQRQNIVAVILGVFGLLVALFVLYKEIATKKTKPRKSR